MGKTTVLVIDDERDLVELVRYNLEREGFEVLVDRAMARCRDERFPGAGALADEVDRVLRGLEP